MIHLTVTVSRSTLRTEFYFCECIALLLLIQQHPLVETEIDLHVCRSVRCDQCLEYLRLVHVVVFEQPEVGGLEA